MVSECCDSKGVTIHTCVVTYAIEPNVTLFILLRAVFPFFVTLEIVGSNDNTDEGHVKIVLYA